MHLPLLFRISIFILGLGMILIGCSGVSIYTSSCTVDGRCSRTELTNQGVFHTDPETGILIKGPTIDQLAVSREYRYAVNVNASALPQISSQESLEYLQQAANAASAPYRLCQYSGEEVIIHGYAPLAFPQLNIVPAHAYVRGDDTYAIFLKYSPGILFENAICIAYRKTTAPQQNPSEIPTEMENVTEALLSLGAQL